MKQKTPKIPEKSFQQVVKELESEDEGSGRFFQAIALCFAKQVNKNSLKESGESPGIESCMEIIENLWNKGYIQFEFNEETESVGLLKFNPETGEYEAPIQD